MPSTPVAPPASSPVTGSVPLTVDASVGLQSVSISVDRLQRTGGTVVLKRVSSTSSAAARAASSWVVRPGLGSANGVSFESVGKPGYYLAGPSRSGGAATVARNTGTKAFAGRATFVAVRGVTGQNTSFQVWAKRSWYLRSKPAGLIAQPLDTSDQGRAATTFAVRAGYSAAGTVPMTTGRSIGLSIAGSTARLVLSRTRTAWRSVSTSSSSASKATSTWIVHTGLASRSGVSFESSSRRGWYLVAPASGSGALLVVKRSTSKAFAARATFTAVRGVTGKETSFRLTKRPTAYLQRSGSHLVVGRLGTSSAARGRATFTVHSGLTPAPTH
jgi:hypothetical protein